MIDILYPFHFNDALERKLAIKRLRTSIRSIKDQDANINVCNTSNDCILEDIKDLTSGYIHKPLNRNVSRALTINMGVRELVKSEYFIVSDIDLIYQSNYVEEILKYTENVERKVRVINYNSNCPYVSYSPVYEDHMKIKDKIDPDGRPFYGTSGGNGLFNLECFYYIHGFEEQLIGYGPEDRLFNEKIKFISDVIISDKDELKTAHIFHTRDTSTDLTNIKICDDIIIELKKKIKEKSILLEDIISNKHLGDNWGTGIV